MTCLKREDSAARDGLTSKSTRAKGTTLAQIYHETKGITTEREASNAMLGTPRYKAAASKSLDRIPKAGFYRLESKCFTQLSCYPGTQPAIQRQSCILHCDAICYFKEKYKRPRSIIPYERKSPFRSRYFFQVQ